MTQGTGVDSAPQGRGDGRYFLAVGVLLVLIIAALAALWLIERSRRMEAQRELASRPQAMDLRSMLPVLRGQGGAEGQLVAPVRREDQLHRPANLDGKGVTAVLISAEAGSRLGFQPGDVVLVAEAPSTAPAGQ